MIKVTLKDGSVREFDNEISVMDIAKSISEGLARAIVAASVDSKVVGLDYVVKEDCELNLFKFEDLVRRQRSQASMSVARQFASLLWMKKQN